MDKDGSDPKNHDEEEIAQQPPPPPPLMLDEDSRVVAVIRNRISPAREGQPEPVLVRTIEPLPVAVPVRIANDIINGKYDDVQLSSSPTEEAVQANPVVDPDQGAAASAAVVAVEQEPADEPVNQLTEEAVTNSVVDPDQGAAAAVVAVKQEPADEPVNQLAEDVTKNLSVESISSTDSESENDSDELPPASPLPRGSRRPPTSPSGATGVRNRLYDHPYPIVRSGRFTNLADVPRVMKDDTKRALREWESPTGNGNNINGSPADECRSVPAWQFRQRRPGRIAKTPPPISDSEDYSEDGNDDDDDRRSQEKLWNLLVTKARKINVQNVRTTPRETTFKENDPPIVPNDRPIVPNDPPLLMRPFVDHMRILELMKRRGRPSPQQQRLVAMGPPPGLPGVLRTRVNSRVTPRRRHSQPSTGAPPLYAGQPPRRSSVPVNHLATNGTCNGNGNGLAEGGWAARHCCENEDCHSFWQHLRECGLQLPPGWHVMLHEDARGRPHAYIVQLDVGANDMVPNLARSLMIDQQGRMQYFMYGAPVDASDNSLPEELNDLAALTEIVDVFARMNHEF
ncbi:uncharacterized protein LOC111693375 [Trichogramma pretiosum]|uniref:uncharacterized protein LOC111693375 n=1 Tax=Trichogramma pretiosum TaxID=7493 RepID=UPI000C719886|nr:uncharacterized protein LOC111693375 [Trichogramma pretiosum]